MEKKDNLEISLSGFKNKMLGYLWCSPNLSIKSGITMSKIDENCYRFHVEFGDNFEPKKIFILNGDDK